MKRGDSLFKLFSSKVWNYLRVPVGSLLEMLVTICYIKSIFSFHQTWPMMPMASKSMFNQAMSLGVGYTRVGKGIRCVPGKRGNCCGRGHSLQMFGWFENIKDSDLEIFEDIWRCLESISDLSTYWKGRYNGNVTWEVARIYMEL